MAAVLSKSPTPAELNGGKESKNMEIAEVIVGAILGMFATPKPYEQTSLFMPCSLP